MLLNTLRIFLFWTIFTSFLRIYSLVLNHHERVAHASLDISRSVHSCRLERKGKEKTEKLVIKNLQINRAFGTIKAFGSLL